MAVIQHRRPTTCARKSLVPGNERTMTVRGVIRTTEGACKLRPRSHREAGASYHRKTLVTEAKMRPTLMPYCPIHPERRK